MLKWIMFLLPLAAVVAGEASASDWKLGLGAVPPAPIGVGLLRFTQAGYSCAVLPVDDFGVVGSGTYEVRSLACDLGRGREAHMMVLCPRSKSVDPHVGILALPGGRDASIMLICEPPL